MQVNQTYKVSPINKSIRRDGLFYVSIINYGAITKSGQNIKKERYVFPSPVSINPNPDNSFCSAERLLKIYNKHFGKNQQKLTKVVKERFESTAYQNGWHTVRFLEDVQTGQTSGCMLAAIPQKGS
ncbi:hypothetical protein OURE66S_03472 [Oligella ureolytica]